MGMNDRSSTDTIEQWISAAVALPSDTFARRKPAELLNRVDIAMDTLKSFIIEKKLQPGDPLPTEQQLCDELRLSRSSIREAVRKLEALHIVAVVHGRGMFVGDMSLEPLVETLAFRATASIGHDFSELQGVIEVREALDLGIAEQLVSTIKGTDQSSLERLTEQMEQRALEGKTFLAQDIAYHSQLIESVENPVLGQLAHSLWLVHMAVLPKLGLQVTTALTETAQAHRNMLTSALAGDVEGYRHAVNDHYEPIAAILKTHL